MAAAMMIAPPAMVEIGAGDLGASLLLSDGEPERDRAPDDQEAAEERDAAGDESDDV